MAKNQTFEINGDTVTGLVSDINFNYGASRRGSGHFFIQESAPRSVVRMVDKMSNKDREKVTKLVIKTSNNETKTFKIRDFRTCCGYDICCEILHPITGDSLNTVKANTNTVVTEQRIKPKVVRDKEFYKRIGRMGGDKTAQTHGREFYEEIGRKGGLRTAETHGAEFYSEIGSKSRIGAPKGGMRVRKLIQKGKEKE
jgi:general stress protein YciG